MRALVYGGRDYLDAMTMAQFLAQFPITEIIHGGARGADTLAGQWAANRGIPVTVFMADWLLYGKAAGHIRNALMLSEGKPHLAIGFPGGRGTADMTRKVLVARIPSYTYP